MSTEAAPRPELILVVDDDVDIARFVEVNLRLHGFAALLARDGEEALELIEAHRPDLALVDVMMPRVDGLELTRRLRANPLTTALPIIMLTAKGMTVDKVVGLTAGADDYLVKPFDTLELIARVRSTLRRNQEFREVSPLTGLPGNTRIQREVADRYRARAEFAVGYIDIDRFKSVNDVYGFVRGDEFISALARSLYDAALAAAPPMPFLGHIGGDDFVIICTPGQVLPLLRQAVIEFERAADALYDETDSRRGFIELTDRRGQKHRAALATLSIGVAISAESRRYRDPRQVIAVASEMKTVAKGQPGSYIAIDRRKNPE
ncbi:hypothetical protein GCM10010123_15360 [Pilimelia anulata]|uniref:Response regulator receiver modulated diguanylate cyclase n=1 Tax=Pilimelia anulata TaxID=53371 RepID=A0A8J3F793_9ACTN|nr:response regulator [Pilimelia anulata]GGJ86710.1 hypothetical protein GCM10010123_15360 [Pilimelia anulata]